MLNIFVQTIREIFINFQSQVDQKPPKPWPIDIAITFVLTGTYQQSFMWYFKDSKDCLISALYTCAQLHMFIKPQVEVGNYQNLQKLLIM